MGAEGPEHPAALAGLGIPRPGAGASAPAHSHRATNQSSQGYQPAVPPPAPAGRQLLEQGHGAVFEIHPHAAALPQCQPLQLLDLGRAEGHGLLQQQCLPASRARRRPARSAAPAAWRYTPPRSRDRPAGRRSRCGRAARPGGRPPPAARRGGARGHRFGERRCAGRSGAPLRRTPAPPRPPARVHWSGGCRGWRGWGNRGQGSWTLGSGGGMARPSGRQIGGARQAAAITRRRSGNPPPRPATPP